MRRLLLISHLAVLAACSTTPAPIDGAADRAAVVEYSRAGAVDSVPDPAYQYFQGRRMAVWNQADREIAFSKWDSVFRARVVKHAPTSRRLPAGAPIAAYAPGGAQAPVLQQYIAEHKVAGIIVLQDGKVRLERYALGHDANSRWTSQSVAKSVAATLVGAAIKDGYIKSIDEPVTTYIPGLRESAYDRVSIRQLLTMTSGVKWNEDYTDTKADIALFYGTLFDPALGRTVSYMRKLPRANPAGSKWVYNTGEANLIGELVSQATGKSLAAYLSEKIWVPSAWNWTRPGPSGLMGAKSPAVACRPACGILREWDSSSWKVLRSMENRSCRMAGYQPRPASRLTSIDPALATDISGGHGTTARFTPSVSTAK